MEITGRSIRTLYSVQEQENGSNQEQITQSIERISLTSTEQDSTTSSTATLVNNTQISTNELSEFQEEEESEKERETKKKELEFLRVFKTRIPEDIGEIEMLDESSCDKSVRLMDLKYKTNFYPWIKSSKNIDFIVNHLKPMLRDYDCKTCARGLGWLFEEWSLGVVANTMIKLFYERGLADEFFTGVLGEILLGRPWAEVVDLVATLSTGEDCEVTATFMYLITKGWDQDSIVDLVDDVYMRARWPEHYYEGVIVYWSGMSVGTSGGEPERLERMQKNKSLFQERSRQSTEAKIPTLSLQQFARKVLKMILADEMSIAAPAQAKTTTAASIETSPVATATATKDFF